MAALSATPATPVHTLLKQSMYTATHPTVIRGRYVSTGAIEEWHRSGPPRRLRLYLCVPVAALVLTKGLMVMVVWLFIKGQERDPDRCSLISLARSLARSYLDRACVSGRLTGQRCPGRCGVSLSV